MSYSKVGGHDSYFRIKSVCRGQGIRRLEKVKEGHSGRIWGGRRLRGLNHSGIGDVMCC